MEQMELDARKKYKELTEEFWRTQESVAENFIIMGFILKQVETECLYRFDGYRDIYEYGKEKFRQSRSTVNRCININTKFSVGGNSRELRAEYKGYSRSALQEMLDMSESDMELITAKTPVDQARELNKAIKEQEAIEKEEQEKNLPLVLMAAGTETDSETPKPEPADPFESILTSFWKKNMELYRKVAAGMLTPGIVAEEISPSGSMTYRDGVNIIFFYDLDKGLKLRSYAKGKAEINHYTYQEFIEKTQELSPIKDQKREKKEPPQNESAAAPQPDQEGKDQPVPYTPVPGQTSVSDLQDIMPEEAPVNVPVPEEKADSITETGSDNVIDGEYRELDADTEQDTGTEQAESGRITEAAATTMEEYTDIEIKNAISFFDLEYSRMAGLGKDPVKRRNYKLALECIRRCYSAIAEQADREMYLTGRFA